MLSCIHVLPYLYELSFIRRILLMISECKEKNVFKSIFILICQQLSVLAMARQKQGVSFRGLIKFSSISILYIENPVTSFVCHKCSVSNVS